MSWKDNVPELPPPYLHPFVAIIFETMRKDNLSYNIIARRSGVSVYTLRRWRRRNNPALANLQAVWDVLGIKGRVWRANSDPDPMPGWQNPE